MTKTMHHYCYSLKLHAQRYRQTYHTQGKVDAHFDPSGQLYLTIEIDDRTYAIAFSEENTRHLIKRLFQDTGDRAIQLLSVDDEIKLKQKLFGGE